MDQLQAPADLDTAAPGVPAPDGALEGVASSPLPISSMARVDLLPLEIVATRRFGRTRRMVIGTLAGILVLAAAGTLWSRSAVSDAQSDLDTANAQKQAAISAQNKYADVPKLEAQLSAAYDARSAALSQDVLWYRYVNDMQGSLPSGVTLTLVNATLSQGTDSAGSSGSSGSADSGSESSSSSSSSSSGSDGSSGSSSTTTTSAGVLGTSGIGSLQVGGLATSYSAVADFLNAMATVTGVSDVTLVSATAAGTGDAATAGSVSFTTTAVINAEALSHRFDKEAS
ncbi:PilN domain-containing protein [Spongisporangium articulatum]|uniref:PilN domain-containing protein n=1 Tax=Spongisporangium articulatum TaxID=3362603 RepID=A0ABW8ASM9_9ACTN